MEEAQKNKLSTMIMKKAFLMKLILIIIEKSICIIQKNNKKWLIIKYY